MADTIEALIAARKAQLDALRPLRAGALAALQRHYDVELTFTSNAIEGNTLTLRETAEVIEHGVTIGGKPLRDHLEAVDHHDAVLWIRALAAGDEPLGEATVIDLHRRIVARSQPDIAGLYSPHPRRVAGSTAVFPNPRKISDLMRDLGEAVARAPRTDGAAFDAHFDLTAIHPFSDGNGRTARLLMNLMRMRGGYPPIAIRPVDRAAYLDGLETASVSGDRSAYLTLMRARLLATLDDYIGALREAD